MEEADANRIAAFRVGILALGWRGLPVDHLDIYPNVARLRANSFLARFGRRPALEYRWPAIVMECVHPVAGYSLLVPVDGRLVKLVIPGLGQKAGNVTAALERAGFKVVRTDRVGFGLPKPVDSRELDLGPNDLPAEVAGISRAD